LSGAESSTLIQATSGTSQASIALLVYLLTVELASIKPI